MTEEIACFGGTFDPVHHGHLIVARALAEARGLRNVTLIPTGSPPHKPPAAAAVEHRLAMLRLATEGEDLFDVSAVETERSGPSYTIDTVAALRESLPEETKLSWIIGADMLPDLPSWVRVGELLDRVELVVAVRPPWQERIDEILDTLAETLGAEQVDRIRRGVVATPLIDLSATEIRRRVLEGRSIRFMVPESVREYIDGYGLYLNAV